MYYSARKFFNRKNKQIRMNTIFLSCSNTGKHFNNEIMNDEWDHIRENKSFFSHRAMHFLCISAPKSYVSYRKNIVLMFILIVFLT